MITTKGDKSPNRSGDYHSLTMNELFRRADFLEEFVCHRTDDFATQTENGGYRRQGRPLRYSDLLGHVAGEQTVGVYQSQYPAETCTWVAYDIDGHCISSAPMLQKEVLTEALQQQGIPFYVERSGSIDSFHIWVFLSQPTPLHLAYNWARAMVIKDGSYLFPDEIFPKQACLNVEKPFGNLIKLPFGLNRKSENWSFFERDIIGHELETVDITGWKPVDLPVTRKPAEENPGYVGIIEPNPERFRMSISGVRPCLQKLISNGVQLESYHGHKLRIAIASEMHSAGHTTEEIVSVFTAQTDFDYGKSLYQVQSVRGYNKPMCATIRDHCRAMKHVTGFDIDEMCDCCLFGG